LFSTLPTSLPTSHASIAPPQGVKASIDYWDSFLDPPKATVGAIERLSPTIEKAVAE
jgi:hypothetical protein